MSPTLAALLRRANHITQATHEKDFHISQGVPKHKKSMPTWAIAVIVVVVIILVAAIVFGTAWWLKRRKYTQANIHPHAADNADDFDHQIRGQMSEAELWEAEERDRSKMIRKSLASRTEYRSSTSNENPFSDQHANATAGDYKPYGSDPYGAEHPAMTPSSSSNSPHSEPSGRQGLSPPPQHQQNPFN